MSTLGEVAAMIRDVMGEDGGLLPIDRDTSFSDDLELESIEIVQLAEKVTARWGAKVDFNAWIAGRSLDEVIGMTVGDLVDFVDSCLS